jgi:hypothetical protein
MVKHRGIATSALQPAVGEQVPGRMDPRRHPPTEPCAYCEGRYIDCKAQGGSEAICQGIWTSCARTCQASTIGV